LEFQLLVEPMLELHPHGTCSLPAHHQVCVSADDALLFGVVLDAVELEDDVDGLLRDRCCG
jgi:hypothetical protein